MKKSFTLSMLLAMLPVFLAAQTPVFYLTFDHMDDDEVEIHDLMNGLLGTASGEIVSGKYGDGYSMNGMDGYIHFDDVVINRGTFTLTTWFKVTTFVEGDPALMQTDGPEEGGAVFIIMYEDGMECFVNNTDGEQAFWAEVSPPQEGWMHFAMVVDTETGMVTLYADGEEIGAEEGSFDGEEGKPLIGPFSIGAHSEDGDSFGRNWNGVVDEFRLYDVALTAEEVVESMEELEGVGIRTHESQSLRIFPNPATGQFSLDQDVASLQIFSISGQEVLYLNDYRAFGQIDVSFLRKGMYFLKAESGGGESAVKLVIQ